jgi:hypothetical protein
VDAGEQQRLQVPLRIDAGVEQLRLGHFEAAEGGRVHGHEALALEVLERVDVSAIVGAGEDDAAEEVEEIIPQ